MLINVQQALIHAYSTHSNHLPRHKAIDLSTYGILFLGTPHQGSETASLATLFFNILSTVKQTNDAIVKHIRKDSEALQLQLSRYSSISAQFDTKFFYESYPTPLVSGIKRLVCFCAFCNQAILIFMTDCSKVFCCCSGCS